MSEKKIILICLTSLFILSTILIYLMLQADLNRDINLKTNRVNINNAQQNANNSETNIKPKIEIEISK